MSGSVGYYRLKRGWMDHDVFARDPYCRRAAWVWLIENAAYKPMRVNVAGYWVELERGQLCYSLRFLAEAWGWELSRVRRFLNRLKDANVTDTATATATATGPTVITLCNYNKYQFPVKAPDTATDTPFERQPTQRRIKGNAVTIVTDAEASSEGQDLDALLYQRGKELLGKNAGGQITKLKNLIGTGKALEAIDSASRKENPAEYVAGIIRNQAKSQPTSNNPIAGTPEAEAAMRDAYGTGV